MIGVGKVGSAAVFNLLKNEKITEISLIDIIPDKLEGEYLDLLHATKGLGRDIKLVYSESYDIVKDSHLVIITAGFPRKDEDSRLDLVQRNIKIIRDIIEKVKEQEKDCLILVVTNPADILTYYALKVSGFDRKKVFGMGTILDSYRLKVVEPNVKTILGEHGNSMVFVPDGISEDSKVYAKKISKRIIETKGGTWWGPAVAIADIVDCIVNDRKDVKLVSTLLKGEYGIEDVCLSVPVKLGINGIEEILEIDLSEKELELLKSSSNVLKKVIQDCKEISI